ncbi:hypothetical protein Q8A67_007430 [Cirrhinus molitorella]|uniref:C-type lectin domain-containing protein n=1 Tax=Cirrhinus molitorella TaxID=172907 RepID=A0AA88PVJ6_9TELE|nr:hypothetical protein Q8A67_007430 [Cirrhinus molitorella]
MAVIGQGQSWDSFGLNFITIFPENIAFYYPQRPNHALNITALYPNTKVEVFVSGVSTYEDTMPAGKPVSVPLSSGIERHQFGFISQTVRISSTKDIVVQSISKKGDSVQTNVVQPMKHYGTFYTIPSLNYSQMFNTFYQSAKNISKRYSSFRLIIISGLDLANSVTIVKTLGNQTYTLYGYNALQLQMDGTETAVYADSKVAVMLTHPCVELEECRCNMVLNQLFPDTLKGTSFIVPSILNTSNFWLHVSSSVKNSASGGDLKPTTLDAFSSKLLSLPSLQLGSQFIFTSYPASLRLVVPGMIIEPISQDMFSACYLAPVSSTDAMALIIAETNYRDSVYIDRDLLLSTKWSSIANSAYSSVLVSLDDTHVIWHPSTKIAVYVFEMSTNVYGGPAIALSSKPDPLGCALEPSKFDVVITPLTWPESLQYCMLISDELFSPSNAAAQAEMANILNNNETMNEGLWIGVRRSLLTLDWYRQKAWSNKSTVLRTMRFHILFMSLVCSGLSLKSFGKDFITAFPENVAYYHPQMSFNALQITAFYNNTLVSITTNYTIVYDHKLQSGQTKIVHFPKYIEQYQYTNSTVFVRVNSTQKIVVVWLSQRGDSVQSTVVQPIKNLGKWYIIPFIKYNQMMASLYNTSDQLALDDWRYSSFRLIIINAENNANSITVRSVSTDGLKKFDIILRPYELNQLQTNGSEIRLDCSGTAAVLLTHPCLETTRCGCNMVVSHVLPRGQWGETFVVPSVKNLNTAWLQVTNTTTVMHKGQNIKTQTYNSSELISFPDLKSGSQFISSANDVSMRLISPGLVVELMPENMFAACFLVQMNSTEGEAVIIAETTSRKNVYVDIDLLASTDWKPIPDSNYSSISVSLSGTHVIWHPTSRIGVYMFEKMESRIPYGSPAVILNEVPDRDGCVADSAYYKTNTTVMTWPESYHYCLNMSYQLSAPSSEKAQKQMTDFLQNNGGPGYLWIGLRRSLFTSEWYWQKGNDSEYSVSYTKWADGHPDKPWKALCASMSNKEFSWKSVPCCTKLRPFCYKEAKYFNEMAFDTLYDHFSITCFCPSS